MTSHLLRPLLAEIYDIAPSYLHYGLPVCVSLYTVRIYLSHLPTNAAVRGRRAHCALRLPFLLIRPPSYHHLIDHLGHLHPLQVSIHLQNQTSGLERLHRYRDPK